MEDHCPRSCCLWLTALCGYFGEKLIPGNPWKWGKNCFPRNHFLVLTNLLSSKMVIIRINFHFSYMTDQFMCRRTLSHGSNSRNCQSRNRAVCKSHNATLVYYIMQCSSCPLRRFCDDDSIENLHFYCIHSIRIRKCSSIMEPLQRNLFLVFMV